MPNFQSMTIEVLFDHLLKLAQSLKMDEDTSSGEDEDVMMAMEESYDPDLEVLFSTELKIDTGILRRLVLRPLTWIL